MIPPPWQGDRDGSEIMIPPPPYRWDLIFDAVAFKFTMGGRGNQAREQWGPIKCLLWATPTLCGGLWYFGCQA